MKLFLGADHGGYYLKEKLQAYLTKRGFEWEDVGDKELDPNDDFPQFAQMAATKVLGEDDANDPRAILICTGGQGMAMAANRFSGIRAAVILMHIFLRGRPLALLVAAVMAGSFSAFPILLLNWGVLYPNFLSVALLPALLAAARSIVYFLTVLQSDL